VAVPATFTSYQVSKGSIVSFHNVTANAAFTARGTAPKAYKLATFSDPNGKKLLVKILSGPYTGLYVSPEDAGVTYTPGP
jgi:hypothetical protein